jgi:hypothetical protein
MAKTEPVAKKKPRVSVLERRLQNPFGEPSSPIELQDSALECRVFNRGVSAQQIYKAKQKGWEYVEPSQLVDPEQAGGFRVSTDGQRLVRGEREEEVLMYMPKSDRKQIEMAKAQKAQKNIRDMKMGRQKEAVVHAAAQRFGGEAGEFLQKTNIVGDVTDSYERIQVTPEVE